MDGSREQQLLDAIKARDHGKVSALVDAEPKPVRVQNESGLSALLLALYYGQRDIADTLRKRWAELDIVEAAALGDLDRVRTLVQSDREAARAYSADGFPVVALAATFGQADVVTFLLDHGADVNAKARNPTGYTALTGAVSQRRPDMVALLIEQGADIDYRYGPGWTVLHESAMQGNGELVAVLLDKGASLNARTSDGKTPLRVALEHNRADVARMLRERGGIET